MPSTKELRRRIRSVKNTAQITKAMQMVAATKMRRAQNQALGGRPYSETLQLAVTELMPAITSAMNPLLRPNSSEKTAILLLTTDKSLCGALNSNVLRLAHQFSVNPSSVISLSEPSLRGTKQSPILRSQTIHYFTVGKKGRDFVVKTGKELLADFENTDLVNYTQAKRIANFIIQMFLEDKVGEVYVLYPDFVSTLKQEPKLEKILPISQEELLKGLTSGDLSNKKSSPSIEDSQGEGGQEFIFDTSKQQLLDFILTHFVQQKIYQSMLETKASEHSARMIAMKNATDNAKELVGDLQLAYNQTRQEGITRELLEITSALAALD